MRPNATTAQNGPDDPAVAATEPTTEPAVLGRSRIQSLDQFRGYTVLGMFLVNFVGSYAAIAATLPLLKHHHTYCSYADTIMPQFVFAVGFAYRLTFLRRAAKFGLRDSYWHALQRNLGLLLVGFVVHNLDGRYESWSQVQELGWSGFFQTAFQRNFFQTLTHIAIASLWIMPVVAKSGFVRISYAIASAALFHFLSAWDMTDYYTWVMKRPGIDGGPLGFLTWTIPMILGTLGYDIFDFGKRVVIKLLMFGLIVMVVGYAIACCNRFSTPNETSGSWSWKEILVEPPFVPPTRPVNIWTMSQRAGSISYTTFGAGFSLALYGFFVLACDYGSLQVGIFRTLGVNALIGYILHDLVNAAIKPFFPKDSPLLIVFLAFGLSLTICYVMLRNLEKQKLFLKL